MQVHLAIDQSDQQLQPLAHVGCLQHLLLVGHAHGKMCGDRVGHARGVVNAGQAGQHFRWQLTALLDQLLEQRDQGARNDVELAFLRVVGRLDDARTRGEHAVDFLEILDRDARLPLHQHLDRAVRKFQQLQHAGQRADLVQVGNLGVVDVGTGLRHQQDLPFAFHRALERPH